MADRRTVVAITAGALLPFSIDMRALGAAKPRRIGFLSLFARSDAEAFLGLVRLELQELGWVDGRHIDLLEPRTTQGRNEPLPAAAAELVARTPDLILVQTLPATRALMQATKSIPIVMAGVGNRVELGIVADCRRPGGNVTGSSFMANEYAVKLLPLLKEAAPRLRSVAVIVNPAAARYVDHILKGARPGELAVEQTTRFNLVINLKTARTLGLTIPQALLLRAGEVIERCPWVAAMTMLDAVDDELTCPVAAS